MKPTILLNTTVLWVVLILTWIIFVGLSIVAGAYVTNTVFAIFKPDVVPYLWQEAKLLPLFEYDRVYFSIQMALLALAVILQSTLFYQIIMVLHAKKVDFSQPFNEGLNRFLKNLSVLSLIIGISCHIAEKFSVAMIKKGIPMPSSEKMHVDGGDVWIFMSIILLVVTLVIRKGIELKKENDLTI